MNGYVKVALVSIVMMVCILLISAIIGPIFGIILILCWLIFTGALGYMEYMSQRDLISRLERAKRLGYFNAEVDTLTVNYRAIEAWGEHAASHGEESSIYKSHDLLFSQMKNIIESAIKFMNTYDYHTNPYPQYLMDLCKQSQKLVGKLHELQNLVLQVDDSTSEVDISYVDDLLSALREMKD